MTNDDKNPFAILEDAANDSGSGTGDYQVTSSSGELIDLDLDEDQVSKK